MKLDDFLVELVGHCLRSEENQSLSQQKPVSQIMVAWVGHAS